MAKTRYFHVKHNTTGDERLVKALRQAQAVEAISGGRAAIRTATDDEIHRHLTTGGALHEKSCAEGEGKLFLVQGDAPTLIRAKNAGAAFQLLNDGAYSVEVATQDALVRLISAGVTVIDATLAPAQDQTGPVKSSTDAEQSTPPSPDATAAANDPDASAGEPVGDGSGSQAPDDNAQGEASEQAA